MPQKSTLIFIKLKPVTDNFISDMHCAFQ